MVSTSPLQEAQGHLANQLALDRVPGPEDAGKVGLRVADLLRRVRRRAVPAPVSPSLQLFCRLLICLAARPARVNRPLALLASLRIVLGPDESFSIWRQRVRQSSGHGGSSPRCNRGFVMSWGSLRPSSSPASSPDDAILSAQFPSQPPTVRELS